MWLRMEKYVDLWHALATLAYVYEYGMNLSHKIQFRCVLLKYPQFAKPLWFKQKFYHDRKMGVQACDQSIHQYILCLHIFTIGYPNSLSSNHIYVNRLYFLYPHTAKLFGGVYWFHYVHLSLCLSVRPSCIPCLLCSAYSSGWIHFRRCDACKVSCKISKIEFLAFLLNLYMNCPGHIPGWRISENLNKFCD